MNDPNDTPALIHASTPHNETMPAMPDPPTSQSTATLPQSPAPHPVLNPCAGCPRWQRTSSIVLTDSAVYWRGANVNATMGELRIIGILVKARGEPVTYRTIYDTLKGIPGFKAGYGGDGFHTNVRSCIKRIRKKFMKVDPTFKCIENLQAYGYSWRRE